jgi:hypothetical protein
MGQIRPLAITGDKQVRQEHNQTKKGNSQKDRLSGRASMYEVCSSFHIADFLIEKNQSCISNI